MNDFDTNWHNGPLNSQLRGQKVKSQGHTRPKIGLEASFSSSFLPRDAMHKRGLCGVCLSCSWVVSKRIDIFEIFSPSGSHAILVFPYQTRCRYSDGKPSNGGVECRWGRQKSRFWAYACCWRCNKRGVVNMVASGRRPPSRKLWQLYHWSYTAGIRPSSATRDKVTVSVVLQRESDQARSRTIHNQSR